uniref:F-box domain-containing protein n=1 Tax=Parastrongyloides trichosuri TaxID=131310 RepID=A0A0N4ZXC4_PARTI
MKKIENGEMNAAEIVGRNIELMRLIFQNIHYHNEKRNFALACKKFYLIFFDERLYVPPFKPIDVFSSKIKTNNDSLIPLVYINGSLTFKRISPIKYSLRKINELRRMFHFYMSISNSICFNGIHYDYHNIIKNLKGYENIKNLEFDDITLDSVNLIGILFEHPKMKPEILSLNQASICAFEHLLIRESLTIPSSIRKIVVRCSPDEFRVISSMLKTSKVEQIDTLKTVIDTESIEWFQDDFAELLGYFKEAILVFNISLTGSQVNTFVDFFQNCHFLTKTKVFLNINLNIYDYFSSLIEDERNIPGQELSNQLDEIAFFSINSINIVNYRNETSDEDEEGEITVLPLKNVLSRCINLKTFNFSVRLIQSEEHFKMICSELGTKIENLQIRDCCDLKINQFKILSESCSNLKNLYLYNASHNGISLKEVLPLFKNLSGLRVEFKNICNGKTILEELTTNYIINWPNINYLQISFIEEEKFSYDRICSIVDKIDKATPRKCGKFLIEKSATDDGKEKLDVIIQKNVTYCEKFNNLFNIGSDLKLKMNYYRA